MFYIALASILPVASALRASGDCGCCSIPGSTSTTSDGCCVDPKTLWFPRSAGDNLVIDQHRFGYKFHNDCCTYGNFGISYRYQESCKERHIAESLFGSCGLSFVGSQAASRTAGTVANNALLADYFGLSQKQDNLSISFCPRVQNHVLDFRFYVGVEELLEGLFLQVNLPLVHTIWNLNGGNCCTICCDNCNCECPSTTTAPTSPSSTTATTCGALGCQTGVLNGTKFPAGYMSSIANDDITPVATLADALNGHGFGDFQGRTYGKFSGTHDDSKFAGIYVDLGYNFCETPDYRCGVYLKVIAPTGTDMGSDAHVKEIFHPIIGDYQWQLGAGISGSANLYCCDDGSQLTLYAQGYATHPFDTDQVRAFDLTNSFMSRYMLMKEFVSPTDLSYNNKLWSVIDWSTRKTTIKMDVKGEALIELAYQDGCGFGAGIGYEVYGRSKEKICKICAPFNSTMGSKVLGLKGCAPVYANGYGVTNPITGLQWTPFPPADTFGLPISATQSTATAYKCGSVDSAVKMSAPNTVTGILSDAVYINPLTFPGGIAGDNAHLVQDTALLATAANVLIESGTVTTLAISATTGAVSGLTLNPTLLTDASLNLCSATLRGYLTNKVYGHLDYIWSDCCWTPSIYIGAEGEFASNSDKNAMNAWGIWCGGSIDF